MKNPSSDFHIITADNGTAFHGYQDVEQATGVVFYVANPHHSWERGANENTNGLIRQYLPKAIRMARLTQYDCTHFATARNHRPRKRPGLRTPAQCLQQG